jgi:hypothetical protein
MTCGIQNDVWLNVQRMHWNKLNIRTDPQDAQIIIGGFDPNFSCLTDYCVGQAQAIELFPKSDIGSFTL